MLQIVSKRVHIPEKIPAMSIGTLAQALGVSRQRVYNLVKQGKIKTVPMAGGSVVLPQEVARVLASAMWVDVKGVERLRFDFSAI
jgi:excisionase family DNA binding protein